jgi:ribosomal protein L1
MELVEKIREVLEKSPKRRFNESVDLSIVLSGVDLKKNPNLKINEIVELENPPKNKDIKVCVFGTW